jgi:hypothetical protein
VSSLVMARAARDLSLDATWGSATPGQDDRLSHGAAVFADMHRSDALPSPRLGLRVDAIGGPRSGLDSGVRLTPVGDGRVKVNRR